MVTKNAFWGLTAALLVSLPSCSDRDPLADAPPGVLAVLDDPSNAAGPYYLAMFHDMWQHIAGDELDNSSWRPAGALLRELRQAQEFVESLLDDATTRPIYRLEYDSDTETNERLEPWRRDAMSPATGTRLLLSLDGRREIKEGDGEGFAERMLAILRIGDQILAGGRMWFYVTTTRDRVVRETELASDAVSLNGPQGRALVERLRGLAHDPESFFLGIRVGNALSSFSPLAPPKEGSLEAQELSTFSQEVFDELRHGVDSPALDTLIEKALRGELGKFPALAATLSI